MGWELADQFDRVDSAVVSSSNTLVFVLPARQRLESADLLAPGRAALQLRAALASLGLHLSEIPQLRWSRGWPGTDGPHALLVEARLLRPLEQLTAATPTRLGVIDVQAYDSSGLFAFTIAELGEVYRRRRGASAPSRSGAPLPADVSAWLLAQPTG